LDKDFNKQLDAMKAEFQLEFAKLRDRMAEEFAKMTAQMAQEPALPSDQITDQLFQSIQLNSTQFQAGFRSIKSNIKKGYLQISECL